MKKTDIEYQNTNKQKCLDKFVRLGVGEPIGKLEADFGDVRKNILKYVKKDEILDCLWFHLTMLRREAHNKKSLEDRVRKLNAELAIAKGKETTKPSNLMFFAILIVGIAIGYFGGME